MNGKFFFIGLILVVLCLLLYLFKSFLMVIAIASLMAVATSNINAKFLSLFHGKKVLAASSTTTLMLLLFFVPFFYAITKMGVALKNFDISHLNATLLYFKNYQFNLPESLAFLEPKIREFIASIDLNSLSKNAFTQLGNFTKIGAKFLTDMVLIIVFYFFANLYGTQLIIYLKSVIPISKEELNEILSEVGNVMAVVFYSTAVISILEGILFALIIAFFGYDGVLFGIIFAFSSLIPAVGGALVYVPLSLYEFALNGWQNAAWIFLASIIIISLIADTFIKPLIIKWINEKLVKTPTQINELLIFLSMLAGISSFGFWGIILGPAILTFFISTIKMYVILKDKKLV
ncbi:AI-2E family transporter [Campylobacter sp. MIT 12-8780]|nr:MULTISPECIES: AI-2E family transporter [unclassified Campylobacter]NDJ27099.1 AI-2E family transporter [Campylobacter sp. MIT 19-121]TKX29676.1 AI-2E family transporter [Campylobacter sp. MIT 12-5580]TQR41601.1 AI-2E family transporter [Campylobacter sp. MIT 12-8780]